MRLLERYEVDEESRARVALCSLYNGSMLSVAYGGYRSLPFPVALKRTRKGALAESHCRLWGLWKIAGLNNNCWTQQ